MDIVITPPASPIPQKKQDAISRPPAKPKPWPLHPITELSIFTFHTLYRQRPENRLARNAIAQVGSREATLNHAVASTVSHIFNHSIKPAHKACDQKSSGRCWLFAGLNPLRFKVMEKYNLSEFSFSANYLYFWDKLEKANLFLDTQIQLIDRPLSDRHVQWALQTGCPDGGQWFMVVNLIKKYGLAPSTVMPETYNSKASSQLKRDLATCLRDFTCQMRKWHADGVTQHDLYQRKKECLEVIYRILATNLGQPPTTFDWVFTDKDDKIHSFTNLTPQQFAKDHVPYNFDDKVVLGSCSAESFHHLYTARQEGNVSEGDPMLFINLPLDHLRTAARKSLADGEALYFSCDVGKCKSNALGLLHPKLYDTELAFGLKLGMDRSTRHHYYEDAPTHAMTLTGYHDDEQGRLLRWKVENSWGKKVGEEGFYVMSDDWFEEYAFEVVVDKKYVPDHFLEILKTEPIVLEPWHPYVTHHRP